MKSLNGAHHDLKSEKKIPNSAKPPSFNAFEGATSLRVLVYFAKSTSALTPRELAVLEEAWDKLALPATMTLSGLMLEDIDLPRQLSLIRSEEGRERTFTATYLFAHASKPCSTKQQQLLNSIRAALFISDEMTTPLSRIYGEVREMAFPELSNFISDTTKRSSVVNAQILKFSLQNAVTGAFPILARSVATGVLIASTKSIMVGDIGHLWGVAIDKQSARALMASIIGESSMRIAIQSLLPESSLLDTALDANSSFMTTWALGYVANKHFESERTLDIDALHKLYSKSLGDARSVCDSSKGEIADAVKSRSVTLELLHEELETGNISTEEYDRKLMGLQ